MNKQWTRHYLNRQSIKPEMFMLQKKKKEKKNREYYSRSTIKSKRDQCLIMTQFPFPTIMLYKPPPPLPPSTHTHTHKQNAICSRSKTHTSAVILSRLSPMHVHQLKSYQSQTRRDEHNTQTDRGESSRVHYVRKVDGHNTQTDGGESSRVHYVRKVDEHNT